MASVATRVADEQWETTTPSIAWINVTARNGEIRQVRVGGRRGMRFRISAEDRVTQNQDQVLDAQHDPFTNGLFFRLSGSEPVYPPQQAGGYNIEDLDKEPEQTEQMLSFQDLLTIIKKHGNAFRSAIAKLNEVNLRRLAAIAEDLPEDQQPTVAQQNALDELLGNYKPGGTQPSYGEFMGGPSDGGVTAAGTPVR